MYTHISLTVIYITCRVSEVLTGINKMLCMRKAELKNTHAHNRWL